MEYANKAKPYPMIKEGGYSIDDYNALPEDGNQYELYDGVLELKPSPTTDHQRISLNLLRMTLDSCSQDYVILYAPVDVILSPRDTRQPDILMVHRSRKRIIEKHAIVGPPDLVVEILSPSTAKKDRTKKKDGYARFGVPEYWIVDPYQLTIEQYVLPKEGSDYVLAEVFDENDTMHSERLPCVAFSVKAALTID